MRWFQLGMIWATNDKRASRVIGRLFLFPNVNADGSGILRDLGPRIAQSDRTVEDKLVRGGVRVDGEVAMSQELKEVARFRVSKARLDTT